MVFKKGQTAWNKGLTKETDERVNGYSKKVKQHMSQFKTYEERYGVDKAKKIRQKQKEGIKNTSKQVGVSKGNIPWNKGKKIGNFKSKEVLENLSKKMKGNKFKVGLDSWNKGLVGYQAGAKHYNWKDGISFEPYSPEWNKSLRSRIKQKFNNEDFITGEKSNLTVHHINYNKKDCTDENLIPLTRSNNTAVNFNRDYWFAFFCYHLKIEPEEQIGGVSDFLHH